MFCKVPYRVSSIARDCLQYIERHAFYAAIQLLVDKISAEFFGGLREKFCKVCSKFVHRRAEVLRRNVEIERNGKEIGIDRKLSGR